MVCAAPGLSWYNRLRDAQQIARFWWSSVRIGRLSLRFALALAILAGASEAAFAYIDQSSGTLLMQFLVSGAMGAVFMLRRRLRQGLTRLWGPPRKEADRDRDAG